MTRKSLCHVTALLLSLPGVASHLFAQPADEAQVTDSVVASAPVVTTTDPLAGVKMLEKYRDLPAVVLGDGLFYQEIHEGTGAIPEDGDVVFFMLKAYNAAGGEIRLGDSNHIHPEGMSDNHDHPGIEYSARWTYFGSGGGSFSLGLPQLDMLFSGVLTDMREVGMRLVYISSENAYGTEGYQGHEFSIPPDTDLVLRITLLRVRTLHRAEELGMKRSTKREESL